MLICGDILTLSSFNLREHHRGDFGYTFDLAQCLSPFPCPTDFPSRTTYFFTLLFLKVFLRPTKKYNN